MRAAERRIILYYIIRTRYDSSHERNSDAWYLAVRVERLQHIAAKHETLDGVGPRSNEEHKLPHEEEGDEGSVHPLQIRVLLPCIAFKWEIATTMVVPTWAQITFFIGRVQQIHEMFNFGPPDTTHNRGGGCNSEIVSNFFFITPQYW